MGENSKSIPLGRIKPVKNIIDIVKNKNLKDKILLIPRTQPLYSNELIDTRFRSSEMINHFSECENFIKNLNKKLLNENLVVRLHSKNMDGMKTIDLKAFFKYKNRLW